jgi:hypothetical protein
MLWFIAAIRRQPLNPGKSKFTRWDVRENWRCRIGENGRASHGHPESGTLDKNRHLVAGHNLARAIHAISTPRGDSKRPAFESTVESLPIQYNLVDRGQSGPCNRSSGATFPFHLHSGSSAVSQQPSMEVPQSNWIVMPSGTPFEVHEANSRIRS